MKQSAALMYSMAHQHQSSPWIEQNYSNLHCEHTPMGTFLVNLLIPWYVQHWQTKQISNSWTCSSSLNYRWIHIRVNLLHHCNTIRILNRLNWWLIMRYVMQVTTLELISHSPDFVYICTTNNLSITFDPESHSHSNYQLQLITN